MKFLCRTAILGLAVYGAATLFLKIYENETETVNPTLTDD